MIDYRYIDYYYDKNPTMFLDRIAYAIKKDLDGFHIVDGKVTVSTKQKAHGDEVETSFVLYNIGLSHENADSENEQVTLEKQSYGGTFQKATATEPKKADTA